MSISEYFCISALDCELSGSKTPTAAIPACFAALSVKENALVRLYPEALGGIKVYRGVGFARAFFIGADYYVKAVG